MSHGRNSRRIVFDDRQARTRAQPWRYGTDAATTSMPRQRLRSIPRESATQRIGISKKADFDSLIGSGAYPTAPAGEGGGWSRSRLSVLKWDPFPEMGP